MNDINVMIDLETLCNDSSGGVILEIGACIFGFGSELRSIHTHTHIGGDVDIFRQVIDIESSLDAGLKIEASTLRWWLCEDDGRSATFRELVKNIGASYTTTLYDFSSWLGIRCNYEWDRLQVWSHGASYDLAILGNHYKSLGRNVPWKFRNQNDTRTLIRLHKELFGLEAPYEVNSHKHNSLADACFQARQMQHIVSRIKEMKALAMRSQEYRGGRLSV